MLRRIKDWIAANRREVMAECFCIAGLIVLGIGLWIKAPWLSLTVVGALVFAVGVFGSINSAAPLEGGSE